MFYETILTIVVLTNGAPSIEHFQIGDNDCRLVAAHFKAYMANHHIKGFAYCSTKANI